MTDCLTFRQHIIQNTDCGKQLSFRKYGRVEGERDRAIRNRREQLACPTRWGGRSRGLQRWGAGGYPGRWFSKRHRDRWPELQSGLRKTEVAYPMSGRDFSRDDLVVIQTTGFVRAQDGSVLTLRE